MNNLRVFVTGGTGFIGSRLVEVLVEQFKADVTVLCHRTSPGALRMAALGVKLDFSRIDDKENLAKAMTGCDAVFHLAFGQSGSASDMRNTTINGTQAMVDAALEVGVAHFINVSTAAVYFGAPDGVIDETAPMRAWGWSYSDEKFEAEQIVRKAVAERSLPASIFQVAGVYGPWGATFLVSPLTQMRQGIVVLPNYGRGIANLTYVDDVVQALLLGLKKEAHGETFVIKGPGTITRMEAYSELEKMLGYEAVVGMDTNEIKRKAGSYDWGSLKRILPVAISELKRSKALKAEVRNSPIAPMAKSIYNMLKPKAGAVQAIQTIGPPPVEARPPLIYPHPIMVDYLSARVEFSSAKATRLLGYSPRYSLSEGMGLSHEWAKWANLLGPRFKN